MIIQLAKKHAVDVEFKGVVDNSELKQLLKNYKYFLSASKFEGNPKSVLEAMYSGCLIIASDIKNHTEFLNNENSILFNNTNSLSKVMVNLQNNHYDYKKLTENALLTIKENYNLENIANLELSDIKKLDAIS